MRRAGPGPTHHQPTLYTRPSTARSLATTRTVIEVPSDGFRARICAWRRAGVRNMSAPSGAKVAISGRAVKTSDNSPRFSDNLKQIKRLRERIVPRSGTNTALQAPGQNRNSRQILAVSKSRTQCHPPDISRSAETERGAKGANQLHCRGHRLTIDIAVNAEFDVGTPSQRNGYIQPL